MDDARSTMALLDVSTEISATISATDVAVRRRARRRPIALTKAALVTADVLAVALAMWLAFHWKSHLPGRDPMYDGRRHLVVGLLSLPIWLLAFANARLYLTRCISGRLDEFRRIMRATFVSLALMMVVAFTFKLYVSRGWLLLTAVLASSAVVAERDVVRRVFNRIRLRGRMLQPVLIVGSNVEALALGSMLQRTPTLGFRVVGFLDDTSNIGAPLLDEHVVLGRIDDAVDAVRAVGATGVLIATTAIDAERSNALTRQLTNAGIHVELSSSLRDIASGRLFVRPLGRFPVVYVEPVRRDGWRARAKRLFDITASAAGLVALLPALTLIAFAILIGDGRPILFRQKRVGRHGVPFEVLKFRTMVVNADELVIDLRDQNEADGPLFKLRHDPRCTRVGRFLRATSLDELPQLWNVLRGEMSLVGPRPALYEEMDSWSSELHQRLEVKPGITGMWQVSGRSSASFDDYVRLDLYYVDNWSLWTDLAILIRTVPTVMLRRGAY